MSIGGVSHGQVVGSFIFVGASSLLAGFAGSKGWIRRPIKLNLRRAHSLNSGLREARSRGKKVELKSSCRWERRVPGLSVALYSDLEPVRSAGEVSGEAE